MKNKIFQLLVLLSLVSSCSEDFITKDLDKSRYEPATFYNNLAHGQQALNAAYSGLNGWSNGYTWDIGIMHFVHGDDLYQTGNAAGFNGYGSVSDFNIAATSGEITTIWNGSYANILLANNALANLPVAQANAPTTDNFTQALLDTYMGQAYFLRAFNYYNLYQYFTPGKIVLRKTVPVSKSELALAPSTDDETFDFIESDLLTAEDLLEGYTNMTAGVEKGRITRGTVVALLGKLYMSRKMYTEAAEQFAKILPGIADGSYGTYSLVPNFRDNFRVATENNAESIFEIQFQNLNGQAGWSNNDVNWVFQNFALNRTTYAEGSWFNFAAPTYKLNDFESWHETINGGDSTVYDYRAYATFWGIPNGASFTQANGNVMNWVAQKWGAESVAGLSGAYGIRKYSRDAASEAPSGLDPLWHDVNIRLIRLADIMLLYAECMANLHSGNVDINSQESALYWVQQVRNRANLVATDQAHLYSSRAGVPGQLPDAATLMANKGWTLMQVVEHERYVEGYCEGWRKEDLKRWEKGADFVLHKSGWTGWQSLILPVPQSELDNNPLMTP